MSGPDNRGKNVRFVACVGWRRRSDRPAVQRRRLGSSTQPALRKRWRAFLFLSLVMTMGSNLRSLRNDLGAAWRRALENLAGGVQELEDVTREQPWATLAAAALAGLIIGLLAARH